LGQLAGIVLEIGIEQDGRFALRLRGGPAGAAGVGGESRRRLGAGAIEQHRNAEHRDEEVQR
jgi:hypothetical protein